MYHLKQKWGIFVTKKDKEILFSNPLFASLGQSECEGLIKNSDDIFSINKFSLKLLFIKSGRAKICVFEKGKAIMTASSFTRCLIVILKGSASVSKIGADGRRTVINILRCGDIFGMATLFFEQDFPSEIIAEEPCRLAIFPKELGRSLCRLAGICKGLCYAAFSKNSFSQFPFEHVYRRGNLRALFALAVRRFRRQNGILPSVLNIARGRNHRGGARVALPRNRRPFGRKGA